MGELLNYFVDRFKKQSLYSEDQMARTLVKNTIASLCEEHLVNVGDIFTFEVLPRELAYAVMVVDEEPLRSKYDITQISKTMFQATLKVVEF